jgi:diguanylate cyclase
MGVGDRFARWAQRFASNADAQDGHHAEAAERPRRAIERHRAEYAAIGDFLFAHDLDVTPLNFAFAQDYLSGSDLAIEKAASAALAQYGCLTNAVVEEIVAERDADRLTPESLEDMLEQVEAHLAEVIEVTEGSRTSARDYGTALKKQVDDLGGEAEAATPAVEKLIALTRTMVETMRTAEARMRASQKDTRALQQSLETARRAAEQDYLTGLPNRRAFETAMKAREAAARENGTALSVAFCDLDHFKAINDTYGHDTGDRVLQVIGERLTAAVRAEDLVCRLGGDEFAILLHDVTEARARATADRILARVAEPIGVGDATVALGATIGIALSRPDREHPHRAVRHADQAMYQAKAAGRGRYAMAD